MAGKDGQRHACEPQRPGDVIFGLAPEDGNGRELLDMGRERGLPGLEVAEPLEHLADVARWLSSDHEEVRWEPDGAMDYTLLQVPEGDELAAASSLVRLSVEQALDWKSGRFPRVVAQPNRYLDLDAGGGDGALSDTHRDYLDRLGLPLPPRGDSSRPRPRVRVIDSGCGPRPNVVRRVNILDPRHAPQDVSDDRGHGTVVTSIIDECTAGQADFEVFKVTDAARKPTEWEVLLALSLGPLPPIVNLSLRLGFGKVTCARCGRRPVSARTGVFEARLAELADAGVTVVAAAGNQEEDRLAYPSRFASTVPVMAWSGDPPRRARYSNWDTRDQTGAQHPNVFVCPGGDEGAGVAGGATYGTSFACAYMTGMLASLWGRSSACTEGCPTCRDGALGEARSMAVAGAFGSTAYGLGLRRSRDAS